MASETPAGRPPRRHGRVRRWVVRPFIWGLVLATAALVALLLFIQSPYARRQAAARVVAAVSEKLGRPVRVGELDFTFLPPAVELHDVVVPGPRPGDPDVARAPLVRIQSTWQDLERRVLRLEQVEVIRPDIYLQFNPDGTTNLPEWRTRQDAPRRFELQIGRVLVQDGTLRVNERRLPLSIDAKAVWGRLTGRAARGGEGGERLDALVTAQEVVTTLPNALPYAATVSVRGSLDPRQGRIRIAAGRLVGPDLRARVDGDIVWKQPGRRAAVRIDARGGARLANRLGYMKEPIAGPFTFRGGVELAGRDLSYSGAIASPRIAVLNREFRGVEADLLGGRDRLDVEVRKAGYAGGNAEGLIAVTVDDGGKPGTLVDLDLTLSGLGLQALIRDQFPDDDFPVVGSLGAEVGGTLRYRFNTEDVIAGSGFADLRVRGVRRRGAVPVSGAVPLRLDRGVVTSEAIRLAAPGQTIEGSGFLLDLDRASGRLGYRLVSRDLGVLTPLLREDARPGEEHPFWLPTAGQGTLAGTVSFVRDEYTARLGLDLRNAVTPDLRADSVRGSLTIRPDAVEDLDLTLAAGQGVMTVAGRVPIPEEGETVAGEPLTLAVEARQWPASSIAGFLLPASVVEERPVRGVVTGRVDLRGQVENLAGQAGFEAVDLAIGDADLGRVQADVTFAGSQVRVNRAVALTAAGNVLVTGAFDGTPGRPGGGTLDFTIDAPSLSLTADPFREALGGRLGGQVSVAAVIGGTLERPEATVRVLGSGLELAGRALGENGRSGTAQALVAWDGESLRATGSLLGLISFDGGGRLDRERADLAFDVRSDELAALARLASPQPVPEFQGSFLGTLAFGADFSRGVWQGELRLADLRAQYEGHTIANLEPVVMALSSERLEVRSFYLAEAETGSELFVSGTVGFGGAMPLDLRIQSTLSAAWMELFAPEVDVEGYLDLLATVRGTAEAPVLSGQGEIRDARLIVPDFPSAVEDIQGFVFLARDGIELEGLRARVGGGRVQASGRLGLPRPGEELSYRLTILAEDLSLRYPEGFLSRGDADIALVSEGAQSRVIRGEVRLDRLFYVEDVRVGTLDLLRGMLQRERVEVVETDEFLAATQLNVQISGPDALRVTNNVANLRGDVDLWLRGTLANPVLFGQVELEEGGTVVYADNTYEIERGLLTFNNPNRIDPVIDIVARTEVRNYDIALNLSGTLDRLSVSFSSDEGLADLEVLALLATGQELEGEGRLLAPGERTESDVGAQTFLAGQAATLVGERVGSLFGFDRFRIDPQWTGTRGGAVGGVRLTVGKRISRDLFVTYSTNPSDSEEYLVRAEWQVAENVVLVLTRDGEERTYAVDAEWEKRF